MQGSITMIKKKTMFEAKIINFELRDSK